MIIDILKTIFCNSFNILGREEMTEQMEADEVGIASGVVQKQTRHRRGEGVSP